MGLVIHLAGRDYLAPHEGTLTTSGNDLLLDGVALEPIDWPRYPQSPWLEMTKGQEAPPTLPSTPFFPSWLC